MAIKAAMKMKKNVWQAIKSILQGEYNDNKIRRDEDDDDGEMK
jgi:hypothetical protein